MIAVAVTFIIACGVFATALVAGTCMVRLAEVRRKAEQDDLAEDMDALSDDTEKARDVAQQAKAVAADAVAQMQRMEQRVMALEGRMRAR